jgi:hypothetical protein
MRPELEWLRGMRYNWEALVHQWNVWVLGYNFDRQRDVMSWFGMRGADWRDLAAALLGAMCVFAAVLLAWSLQRRAQPGPGPGRVAALLPQARRAGPCARTA